MALEFIGLTDQEQETANKSHSLKNQQSPFTDGVVFNITGFGWRKAVIDGKKSQRNSAVLTTPIGDLFLGAVTKGKCDAEGQIHRPKGTFVDLVLKVLQKDADNETILKGIVDAVKDHKIVCSLEEFAKPIKGGGTIPASVLILHLE